MIKCGQYTLTRNMRCVLCAGQICHDKAWGLCWGSVICKRCDCPRSDDEKLEFATHALGICGDVHEHTLGFPHICQKTKGHEGSHNGFKGTTWFYEEIPGQ